MAQMWTIVDVGIFSENEKLEKGAQYLKHMRLKIQIITWSTYGLTFIYIMKNK